MSVLPPVAIFWDYENCSPPSNSCGLGYGIVNNIARIARLFGSVTTFRAYLDISAQSPKSVTLRSELQSSGVSIIDCPHNGKKDVVDKMILVDMLAFAVDHPSPATIFLITGDRDYAYAVSILKLRKYKVVLLVPSSTHTSPSLESQASLVIDWSTAILRSHPDSSAVSLPVRQPYSDVDASLVNELLKELQEPPLDDTDLALSSASSASRLRRVNTRDLLESSRHSRNTDSLDSTQDFTHGSASPTKSTITRLSVPRTPSHSRRASVSTGSAQTRNTSILAQCPQVMVQHSPAKILPPSTPRRSSSSDVRDVADLANRSLSVSASLDPLELSLHDDGPPSSIIVRSPLQPASDIPEDSIMSSSHRLASPLITAEARTGSQPVLNQQSHATIKPTSLAVAPDIRVPREIERPTGPHVENTEGIYQQSVPHLPHPEGARDGADLATSNYNSYVAPYTMHHPLTDTNAALRSSNCPENTRVPLPNCPGARDGDDDPAQFAAFPCVSTIRDWASPGSVSATSSASPSASASFAATASHEREGYQAWAIFEPLIHVLLAAHASGITRPSRSTIAVDLVNLDKEVYQRAGVSRFRQYTALAEQAGLVELGSVGTDAWIALHPDLYQVDEITTTRSGWNTETPSPTFDSPKLTQIPLGTSFGTPLIEKLAGLRPSEHLPTEPQRNASGDFVPAQFQPLIDALVRMRTEGTPQPRRSVVGQTLDQVVYSQAGVSGFKEYIHQASEAELIEMGGIGGHAWISLHPERQF